MTRRIQRGFTLIEALVALAVMAFGMLGVLGIQATLRQYSDVSKQRSEATRIAQDAIEDWRAFTQMAAGGAGIVGYADIVSDASPLTIVGAAAANKNTTFTIQRIVVPLPNPPGAPMSGRWVNVQVNWRDRSDGDQSINFSTHIAGVTPELAGTLLVPPNGSPTRLPQGRNAAVPRAAIDMGDGTSRFTIPTGGGTTWLFNNTTGAITRICIPAFPCTDFVGYLLSGYVRYIDNGVTPPSAADAENPTSPLPLTADFGVSVAVTLPTATATVCYVDSLSSPLWVAYYCAMSVFGSATIPGSWSGRSTVTSALPIATLLGEVSAAMFRVCRYTPIDADTGVANVSHPLVYTGASQSLANQNFVVIRAGDGTTRFDCPTDDTSTPGVNGNTWDHQPSY